LVDKVLSDNPSIKWIHSFSAGVDLLMTPEIRSKSSSVVLTNAKGAFSESLGEFVAFAMLWFCKRGKKWLDDKTSKKWDPGFLSMLSGMTLGIVGYGDIGSECARVAKNGFNMKVLAVKRDPSKCTEKQRSFADEILPSDEIGMQKLLSVSDFVVNVMPYTPETHGFFDLQKFS